MQRKLERWLATYLYLCEIRFEDIKGNTPYCEPSNWNAWYLLIEYSQLEPTRTGTAQMTCHYEGFWFCADANIKSYLHAEHIFSCYHVLEYDCRSQDSVRVQSKLLLFITREDGEGKGGPVVKRVFVCHHQLQNACAHWFIFLCTYRQCTEKSIKITGIIIIIKYHTLLLRIFNWMLFAQDEIWQADFILTLLISHWPEAEMEVSTTYPGTVELCLILSLISTNHYDSDPEQGGKKCKLFPAQTFEARVTGATKMKGKMCDACWG